MNIDKHRRTPRTLKHLNARQSYSAHPIITLPTRVTDHSSTIIDHIITNYTLHKNIPEILPSDSIRNHFAIFFNINKCTVYHSVHHTFLSVIGQNLTLMRLNKIC